MNCKPGDLAYTVHPFKGSLGSVVKIERSARYYEKFGRDVYIGEGVGWVCTGNVKWMDGSLSTICCIADECLCPITPPPGKVSDEEVKELFSPSTVKEEA